MSRGYRAIRLWHLVPSRRWTEHGWSAPKCSRRVLHIYQPHRRQAPTRRGYRSLGARVRVWSWAETESLEERNERCEPRESANLRSTGCRREKRFQGSGRAVIRATQNGGWRASSPKAATKWAEVRWGGAGASRVSGVGELKATRRNGWRTAWN